MLGLPMLTTLDFLTRAAVRSNFNKTKTNHKQGFTMAIITRAEWRKMRDRNGVGKGHAKVSIGAALDAYHASKTCEARIAKLDALAKAYATYANSLDAKVPGEHQLAREIGGQLLPEVREVADRYEERNEIAQDMKDLTVDKILKDRPLLALYTPYAKKEFTDESLDFVKAVDKKMKKQDIYEMFISPKAKRQVNLPGGLQSKLDKLAEKEEYDKMDLVEVRKEICEMLNRDSLPRFKLTPEFKDLLNEMAGTTDALAV